MAVIKKTKYKNPLRPLSRWIGEKPIRLIISSFVVVILIGAFLLMLPIASQNHLSAGFLRALFVSTSATCVTGLVVVDTATYWTTFGKVVIICLIQVGGLGLVTLTSFFFSVLKKKASLKTRIVTQESIATPTFADVFTMVRRIVLIVFTVEFLGAVILTWRFSYRYPFLEALGKGVFQAISAFCNAGFDLHGDSVSGPFSSLTAWNNDPITILTTSLLIIIGGLGFIVWTDLIDYRQTHKLAYHSKVVLWMTGFLLAVGTVSILGLEYSNTANLYSIGSLPVWQRPLAAFFQSVTARTAGFNSIDQASLHDSSKLITSILMFIGAAPASTGGGIKCTTFGVIVATIYSDIRGFEETLLFRHRINREVFTRAMAIMGLALTIVLVATMAICIIETEALDLKTFDLNDVLLEAVSAFGTVGLTSAGTPTLHPASWAVLIPCMFLGRVGPASFAISLSMKRSKRELVYPEGRTLVG